MDRRPNRGEYFMSLADTVSQRATCDRAHVGCVLVKGDCVVSTGYNGAPPELPHCDDVGHDMEAGHCVRVNHAEENAIIQAAKYGIGTEGCTAYCTVRPVLGVPGFYTQRE